MAVRHLSLSDHYFGETGDSVGEALGCTVNIVDFDYGLTRAKVPGTDDSYYSIPGMILTGNVAYYGKKTGNAYYEDEDETLIILNAIDGSVINSTNE